MLRCKECKRLLGEALRVVTGEWVYNCSTRGVPLYDKNGKTVGMTADHADYWFRVRGDGVMERVRVIELQGTRPREYVVGVVKGNGNGKSP